MKVTVAEFQVGASSWLHLGEDRCISALLGRSGPVIVTRESGGRSGKV